MNIKKNKYYQIVREVDKEGKYHVRIVLGIYPKFETKLIEVTKEYVPVVKVLERISYKLPGDKKERVAYLVEFQEQQVIVLSWQIIKEYKKNSYVF